MVIIDNSKYTDALSLAHGENTIKRIVISQDMFIEARNILADGNDYVIATDSEGNDALVLRWDSTTYVHNYTYSGSADLWFLDQYDVLLLYGCNEYSVELCLSALRLWKGKKVVFVGREWQYIIDLLPDIDGKKCIWEDDIIEEDKAKITEGEMFLEIKSFMPHEETLDRYNRGIMSYDEVMAFTFLFSDKREFGEKNPNINFCVIDGNYGNLGIFALYEKAISLARYTKAKGFIPVIAINNELGEISIYQDSQGDEIWTKFFNQPEKFSLDEVMQSKNVYFTPFLYNARIMQYIMDGYCKEVELSWPSGIYNSKLKSYLEIKEKEYLPYPDKTLGVLARGTDFVNTRLSNHAIHASKEMIADKIEELLEEWKLDYVYMATEDAGYYDYFKGKFGERIYMTDQERYVVQLGEILSEVHRKKTDKRSGYVLGAEYISAIYLLSKCNSFMASGGCSGVGAARRMNDNKFKHTFVFNLGKNK